MFPRLALLVPLWLLLLAATARAGTCPKYPIIRDFDFQRYMGLWFQQDKLQNGWEMPGRCWKTLYSRDRKNGMFKMKMIYSSTITGRNEEYDSQLTLGSIKKPSVIKYSIPMTLWSTDEFQVLATDYESFAIEYKCDPNGFLEKTESIFLQTREKNPSPLVLQRAYAIMHRLGVDIRKLERVDQTCGGLKLGEPEYPVYDDYYTNEAPDNRRYQNEHYDYYDYSAGPVVEGETKVDPSPSSHQQGWVPVEGSSSVQHNTYQQEAHNTYQQEAHNTYQQEAHNTYQQDHTASGAAAHSGGPQYVEMQPVDHLGLQQKYQHPQQLRQPDPKITLRQQGGNRRNSGGNRRVARPPHDDRITLGQSLATKLWQVLHSPISK